MLKEMQEALAYPQHPVVLIDDEDEFLRTASYFLRSSGITNCRVFSRPEEALHFIRENPVSVVTLDLTMPEGGGKSTLQELSKTVPHIPVLIITAQNELRTAVECMKCGAHDYITKPFEESRFVAAVRNAIELNSVRNEAELLKLSILKRDACLPKAFSSMITADESMFNIFQYAKAIAPTPLPVLVTGETGVGKELMAQAIHTLSQRQGAFVPVNIAGLDAAMFTDSLFGHRKGSFTGAETERKGLVEQACGGTLFLDEIGDLCPDSQVKLLRLLQENQYYPLGSDVPKKVNVRIIAATNRDLKALKNQGEFRSDLFFRLQAHEIFLPPLRDRKKDIPFLVDHYLTEAAHELNKNKPTPPPELFDLLEAYSFPGNIRELRGLIYNAVTQHRGGVLSLSSIKQKIGISITPVMPKASPVHPAPVKGLFKNLSALPTLKETEELLVEEALSRSHHNISLAGTLLGMSRQALSARLHKKS